MSVVLLVSVKKPKCLSQQSVGSRYKVHSCWWSAVGCVKACCWWSLCSLVLMGNAQDNGDPVSPHNAPRYRSRSSGAVLRGLRRQWGPVVDEVGRGGVETGAKTLHRTFGYSVEVLVRAKLESVCV